MKQSRRALGLSAVVLSFSLLAAACGSDSDTSGTATTEKGGTAATATTAAVAGKKGGEITVGAEQEPDCTDWIGSCAGASWGVWSMQANTVPRAFDIMADGQGWKYQPSALLAGEPEVKTSPKQVITYKLNPKAVWSDGSPITCSDFKYTWDQIKTGKDIYDTSGYADIESVDDANATSCVVTFAKTYAPWKSLFGAAYGVLPSKLLTGKDRNAEMKDGYTWSGGPFKIEKWTKGASVTLVRNDKYWADQALLDKVTFKFVPDTAAEFAAFKSGEVMAIYPQPQLDAIDQIANLTGIQKFITANTGNFEGLWMNNSKAPLDSVKVRQAIGYGLDRDAIVKRLFGGVGLEKALNTINGPIFPYKDENAFAGYKKDLKKVDELMTSDGWAKGADGIWAKGGTKASIEFKTTTGNKRRELTQQVVQQQLKEAGFDIVLANAKAGDLFGKMLPAGDFTMALYAQVMTTLDSGNCSILCSKNIPGPTNNNAGQNYTRTNVPALDKPLETLDSNPDDAARKAAGKEADKLMAENMVSLPLDPLPNIGLASDKITGVSENPVYSIFGSLSKWSLK